MQERVWDEGKLGSHAIAKSELQVQTSHAIAAPWMVQGLPHWTLCAAQAPLPSQPWRDLCAAAAVSRTALLLFFLGVQLSLKGGWKYTQSF